MFRVGSVQVPRRLGLNLGVKKFVCELIKQMSGPVSLLEGFPVGQAGGHEEGGRRRRHSRRRSRRHSPRRVGGEETMPGSELEGGVNHHHHTGLKSAQHAPHAPHAGKDAHHDGKKVMDAGRRMKKMAKKTRRHPRSRHHRRY
jgi:hypothetical protein